jgi:hypothetical protein
MEGLVRGTINVLFWQVSIPLSVNQVNILIGLAIHSGEHAKIHLTGIVLVILILEILKQGKKILQENPMLLNTSYITIKLYLS